MGGVLAVVSLVLASYATELWQLYITYGVMLGLALGSLGGSAPGGVFVECPH